MIGKWTWNLYAALAGMVLTFMFSIPNNLVTTSLLRSVYAFICFFALGFVVRFLLGTAAGLRQLEQNGPSDAPNGVGERINLSTPEEGGLPLTAMSAESDHAEDAFKPLVPKPLKSTADIDPEKVTAAVRKMSEE